jgi:hypothetical protein
MTDRAALVEKVAQMLPGPRGQTWPEVAADVIALVAPVIRAETLEEAAQHMEALDYSQNIAAAIRALMDKA